MNAIYIYNILLLVILVFTILNLYKLNKENFSEGIVGTTFVSRVPKGLVSAYYPGQNWDKSSIPPGWVLCDGNNGTPDLRGRFVLGFGQGSNLSNRNLGDIGGEENHTLKTSEIPPHTHGYTTIYLGGGYSGGGDTHYNNPGAATTTNGSENNGLQGQAHNNMPPFYTLIYIMKT